MSNSSDFAIHISLMVLSVVAILCGMGAHFWVLARVEETGFRVKYFATIADQWRAYSSYRQLVNKKQVPAWPFYLAVVGMYGGLVGLCAIVIADHSLREFLARWHLGRWLLK
jgi:hypothetical protein